jgi:geranylgeranyl pyrophosphate synthase
VAYERESVATAPLPSAAEPGPDQVSGARRSLSRIEHYELMRRNLAAARDYLTSTFDTLADGWSVNSAEQIGRYVLGQQGKMMRASITVASCAAVGGDPAMLTPVVGGIEYGHLASLMHDDLIDGDMTRRQLPTVWNSFGASDAIIAGDLLIFAAFYALANCRPQVSAERVAWALKAVSRAGIDACFGTSLEMQLTGQIETSLDTYLKMASGKAGAVFRGGSEGGAILGGGSADEVDALKKYGDDLGIAFQIVDDLLPFESDEKTMGKPVYSDLRNRRPTLPVLLGAQRASGADLAFLHSVFADEPADRPPVEEAFTRTRDLLERTGAFDEAHRLAGAYCTSALHRLDRFGDNEGVQILTDLVQIGRDRVA